MNNLLIRYCFALPEKISPDGLSVNGIYGMCRFFKKYIKKEIICCADKCSNNFRKKLYEPYKKNRQKLDLGIYKQIEILEELCREIGIPVLWHDEYEADDIIATMCQKDGSHTVFSTDKDLLQLCIYDNVTLINPFGNQVMNNDVVMKKYGINVKDFTLFLALMGDASDNIPGITGIGPKTAAKIINEGFAPYKHKFDFSPLDQMISLVKLHTNVNINFYSTNIIDQHLWNQKMDLMGFNELII